MSIGIPEIILILVVVLLIFGGKRIPELARSLGRAKHEYKKAKEAIEKEAENLEKAIDTVGASAAKVEASKTEASVIDVRESVATADSAGEAEKK